jgi:hypothetical protein
MHQCLKFILFWSNTVHVSDGFSVHHQEFKTIHTATGICQTDTAVWLLASRQQYMIDIMFRMVFPSIIRSSRLYIQQQAYVKQQYRCLIASKQTAIYDWHNVSHGLSVQHQKFKTVHTATDICQTSVWHMPVAVCTVLHSWWWKEKPSINM